MSTKTKADHSERTENEPRSPSLRKVILARVDEINPSIRTFRLTIPPGGAGIRFLPGQWLDVFVPGIPKPGGFTITSPPSKARPSPAAAANAAATTVDAPSAESPYIELAIQKSPENIVANWLWQPPAAILNAEIWIRVGGSFVWPPPGLLPRTIRKAIFLAGGVGINPLMSIVSQLAEQPPSNPLLTIDFLYSLRDPGAGQRDPARMLFLERLAGIFGRGSGDRKVKGDLKLFLTNGRDGDGDGDGDGRIDGLDLPFKRRRVTIEDIAEAVGDDKRGVVVYVCGVPKMTDDFVEKLTSPTGLGLEPHRVLYEKWW
ncbi:unnamed protein product [Discula destructiva]